MFDMVVAVMLIVLILNFLLMLCIHVITCLLSFAWCLVLLIACSWLMFVLLGWFGFMVWCSAVVFVSVCRFGVCDFIGLCMGCGLFAFWVDMFRFRRGCFFLDSVVYGFRCVVLRVGGVVMGLCRFSWFAYFLVVCLWLAACGGLWVA